MFGYIVPRMDKLEESQRKRYRAVYCGLCQTLGEISDRSGRLLLSHDMTFLALLLTSLEEPAEEMKAFRCPVHPVKRQTVIRNRAVDYAAAMNLLLMDMKCEDQIRDDHSRLARTERKRLGVPVEKVAALYPTQAEEARSALKALWREEQASEPDPDRLCNFSGEMLGAVFVPEWVPDFWKSCLRGLGAGLGRFVYWMDAWEDYAKDLKKRRFNPISRLNEAEKSDESIYQLLEMMIGEAAEYFEALPLEMDLDLLRNVMYSGVWQRYEALSARREKEKKI